MEKLISCIDQGVKYTGRNVTKKHGKPYLLSSSYEINLLASLMKNYLGLCYTTLFANCHCHTNGDNAVSRSTVNLAFKIIQPKITKIKKVRQGTKNEEMWKEARYRQVKQWLIMINRLPEEKE